MGQRWQTASVATCGTGGMKQVGGKVGVVVTGSKGGGEAGGAGREQTLGAMPHSDQKATHAPDPKAELRGEGCTPPPLVPYPRERWVSDGLA